MRPARAMLAVLLVLSGMAVVASPVQAAPGVSDDFNATTLNGAVWTEVSTQSGPTFTYTGAQAAIVIPGGSTGYAPWTGGNKAPTLRQSLTGADRTGDIDVTVAFGSIPSIEAQTQGLIFADSTDNNEFLRFDVFFDGTDVRAFSADPLNSTAFLINQVVPSNTHARYLRVVRTAATNTWEFFTAATENPASWTSQGSFVRPMTVTDMGPFIGSSSPGGGAPVPGFVGVIDYFGDLPVPVGATGSASDTTAATISNITTQRTTSTLTVQWETSEPTTSSLTNVTLGGTTGSTTETATGGVNHEVTLTGLTIGTNYNLRIDATDINGNPSQNAFSAATSTNDDGPVIDLWYGDDLVVGSPGLTQRWANILGNTSDPDGIGSLTYSLNGGADVNMGLGVNTERRLGAAGDFNVDILVTDLNVGENTVTITSTDTNAQETTRDVTITRIDDVTAPPAFGLVWDNVTDLEAAVDVIDGKWAASAAGLTIVEPEYDRLVGFGDQSWSDYQVLVPITVHSRTVGADASPSFGPGIGVFLRWNGHTDSVGQPEEGFLAAPPAPTPFGALTWWQDPAGAEDDQLRITDVNDSMLINAASDTSFDLTLGTEYMLRAEAVGNFYRLKMWPSASPEPGAWDLEFNGSGNSFDPDTGSILLVAHEVSATFGDVLVLPRNANAATKATNPVLSPANGIVNEGEAVQVTVPDGAVVYYTTDGSDPTPLSNIYEGGVAPSADMKFISYETGKNASDIISASFSFNMAPEVDAGTDQTGESTDTISLNGTATDDAGAGGLTVAWSKLSGPGDVTFADAATAATTATFSAPGTYVLQLLANDGQIVRSDEVTVTITSVDGYWILNAAGGVQEFGAVLHHGDLDDGPALAAPASAIATTEDKKGYWVAQENGAVTPFGSANDAGGLDDLAVVPTFPIVSMARSSAGDGYYLLGSDGGVFAFNAPFYGSTGDIVLDLPVVAMAAHPTDQAYWFVARDGGIFAFGPDVEFHGSLPQFVPYANLAADVVGMAVTATGKGYWLVAADGGMFAFGDAEFHGSIPGVLPPGATLAAPIVGMVATSTGDGYWLIAEDGGVFAFGDAQFFGSNPSFGTVVGLAG